MDESEIVSVNTPSPGQVDMTEINESEIVSVNSQATPYVLVTVQQSTSVNDFTEVDAQPIKSSQVEPSARAQKRKNGLQQSISAPCKGINLDIYLFGLDWAQRLLIESLQ